MRIDGKLKSWNDDKGFGFITPNQGGQDIFVHISAFPRGSGRPQPDESLSFEIELNPEGQKKAVNIQRPQARASRVQNTSVRAQRQGSSFATTLISLILLGGLVAYGYTQYTQRIQQITAAEYSTAAEESVHNSNITSQHDSTLNEVLPPISEQNTGKSDAIIANTFSNHDSNQQVSGQGVVTRLLPDDNNGSRHQRFIIKLPSDQSLLISHNIDLAPRINALQEGDSVQFYGEYEWNEKGGVVHWTHRDPNGSHVAGWLQHQGQRYQ